MLESYAAIISILICCLNKLISQIPFYQHFTVSNISGCQGLSTRNTPALPSLLLVFLTGGMQLGS